MVIDRDIDALMTRTQGRPLVTGLIESAQRRLVFALVARGARRSSCCGAGANLLSAVLAHRRHAVLRLRLHALAEAHEPPEHRHRRRRRCGARPGRLGRGHATASAGRPVVLFAVIFLWTPPHFWALAIRHADDYRAANVPMLPAVATMPRSPRDKMAALHRGAGRVLAGAGARCRPRLDLRRHRGCVVGGRVPVGHDRSRPQAHGAAVDAACSASASPTSPCCSAR